jgi:hypothetical protein
MSAPLEGRKALAGKPRTPTSTNPSMNLVSVPDFIDSVSDRTITGGKLDGDELHLYLDDGRILVFIEGIVCIGNFDKETLQ